MSSFVLHNITEIEIRKDHQVGTHSNIVIITAKQKDGNESIKHEMQLFGVDAEEVPVHEIQGRCY